MPANAAAAATDIFTISVAAGNSKAISKSPSEALWVAPTIEGSIKRFFIKICKIMPATAIEAPVSTMANVRGSRLVSSSCHSSGMAKQIAPAEIGHAHR